MDEPTTDIIETITTNLEGERGRLRRIKTPRGWLVMWGDSGVPVSIRDRNHEWLRPARPVDGPMGRLVSEGSRFFGDPDYVAPATEDETR